MDLIYTSAYTSSFSNVLTGQFHFQNVLFIYLFIFCPPKRKLKLETVCKLLCTLSERFGKSAQIFDTKFIMRSENEMLADVGKGGEQEVLL